MLRSAINSQVWLSRKFDKLLPRKYQTDGNSDFVKSFAPGYLFPKALVYDIGSGKQPFLKAEQKRQLQATVVGLDIDAGELARAPQGAYDDSICSDVTRYQGKGDADIVICQSLLEHVNGVDKAFHAISSALKPGGTALVFVPSRNAVFARMNLLLPHRLKRWILFSVFPVTKAAQGFVSYYDRCTPGDFRQLAAQSGLEVVDLRCYYKSGYFTFLFPLHFIWRAWILLFGATRTEQAAETFSMALRKPATH
jgi:SAM-dependent methyltransferase